jgi:hypothetical protein
MSHDPKLANHTAGSGHFRCFDRFGLGWTGYRIFPLSKQQLHDQPNAMGLWWNGVGLLGPRGGRLFTADLKRPSPNLGRYGISDRPRMLWPPCGRAPAPSAAQEARLYDRRIEDGGALKPTATPSRSGITPVSSKAPPKTPRPASGAKTSDVSRWVRGPAITLLSLFAVFAPTNELLNGRLNSAPQHPAEVRSLILCCGPKVSKKLSFRLPVAFVVGLVGLPRRMGVRADLSEGVCVARSDWRMARSTSSTSVAHFSYPQSCHEDIS